jgi:hypothetical protein
LLYAKLLLQEKMQTLLLLCMTRINAWQLLQREVLLNSALAGASSLMHLRHGGWFEPPWVLPMIRAQAVEVCVELFR